MRVKIPEDVTAARLRFESDPLFHEALLVVSRWSGGVCGYAPPG